MKIQISIGNKEQYEHRALSHPLNVPTKFLARNISYILEYYSRSCNFSHLEISHKCTNNDNHNNLFVILILGISNSTSRAKLCTLKFVHNVEGLLVSVCSRFFNQLSIWKASVPR